MPVRFRLLTESDVKAVLTMDDLIVTMATALSRFSTGAVMQPVRTVIPVGDDAFCGLMPAYVPAGSLGTKVVTVFGGNTERGMPSHLASILLLDPETGALQALLDGRFITESRTAAVSAVSSRMLACEGAKSLAIIGSGVQARSHLDALSRVHELKHIAVWSPNKAHRDQFAAEAGTETGRRRDGGGTQTGTEAGRRRDEAGTETGRSRDGGGTETGRGRDGGGTETGRGHDRVSVKAVDHPGEAIVGADLIVLVTSSSTPVIEAGWVKPGAHVMSVGACRPTQREMDPDLVARARLFVDSRAAALVESGDIVLGIQEGRFTAEHIVAEIGELVNGTTGRRAQRDITIFKSLGLAVEDVMAADLAYRRALERGIGVELTL